MAENKKPTTIFMKIYLKISFSLKLSENETPKHQIFLSFCFRKLNYNNMKKRFINFLGKSKMIEIFVVGILLVKIID